MSRKKTVTEEGQGKPVVPESLLPLWEALPFRHQEFIGHLMRGKSQADAYRIVYPDCDESAVYSCASELLRFPKVKAFMDGYKMHRWSQYNADVEYFMAFCIRAVMSKPSDIVDEAGNIIEDNADLVEAVTVHYDRQGNMIGKTYHRPKKAEMIKIAVTLGLNLRGNDTSGLYDRIQAATGLPCRG